MRVEILYVAGCPHRDEAERRVRRVLAELGCDADIACQLVADTASASRLGFVGSPTIRVNGEDVVPAAPGSPPACACRIYRIGSVVDSAPDLGAIRAAIERSIV